MEAWISDEARENLQLFARANGVSFSAFLEALGQALEPDATRFPGMKAIVDTAREVDTERRRRH